MQIALKKANLICFGETATKSTFRKRLMPPASQEGRGEKVFLLRGCGLCWKDVSRIMLSQLRKAPIGTSSLQRGSISCTWKGRLFLKTSQEPRRPQLYSQTSGLPVNYTVTAICHHKPLLVVCCCSRYIINFLSRGVHIAWGGGAWFGVRNVDMPQKQMKTQAAIGPTQALTQR